MKRRTTKMNDLAVRHADQPFVLGDPVERPITERTSAIEDFLSTGNPNAVVTQYVAAVADELANRPWYLPRLKNSRRMEVVIKRSGSFYKKLEKSLEHKNNLITEALRHATARQRYDLEMASHATALADERVREARAEARIAEQLYARAQHEVATNLLPERQAAALQAEIDRYKSDSMKAELKELRELVHRLQEQLQRAADTKAQPQAGHQATSPDGSTNGGQSPEARRQAELAQAQHHTRLLEEQVKQTKAEEEIRNLSDPSAAREKRVKRQADDASREPEDQTLLLEEFARRGKRAIERTAKEFPNQDGDSLDGEVVERTKNAWDARLRNLPNSGEN